MSSCISIGPGVNLNLFICVIHLLLYHLAAYLTNAIVAWGRFFSWNFRFKHVTANDSQQWSANRGQVAKTSGGDKKHSPWVPYNPWKLHQAWKELKCNTSLKRMQPSLKAGEDTDGSSWSGIYDRAEKVVRKTLLEWKRQKCWSSVQPC